VTLPGEKGFVRGTLDTSTGLTQLGARSYDPDTGRFLSVDPLLVVDDPQQLDGYSYAGNGPVNGSDPTGLARSDDDNIGQYRDGKWVGSSPPQVSTTGSKLPQAGPPAGPRQAPPVRVPSCDKGGDCKMGSRGVARVVTPKPPAPPTPQGSKWSISFCFSSSIQLFIGRSGEGCLALDGRGFGHSEASKTFVGPGLGVALTGGPKVSSTDIPGLDGGDVSFGGEVKAGVAAVGVEGAVSDDGSVTAGAAVGPALGIGGRLKGLEKIQGFNELLGGSALTAGRGEASSGYYFQWGSWVDRVQQANQEAARNGTLQDRVHG
jgi:RHS repeat-associated protein